jgi:L-iditol 2-dehydrogenase
MTIVIDGGEHMMLQTMITAPGTIEYRHVDIPFIGDDEVLVEMQRAGVCASDVQVYHGQHRHVLYPLVQGHEGCGVVVRKGKLVNHVAIGDLVTVQPQLACGLCFACRQQRFNVCETLRHFGISHEGLFEESVRVPSWNAVRLPRGMDAELGALVEPAAVAINAARKGNIQPGYRVVVMGAGIIGNYVAQVAQHLGAEVILTDVLPNRLELAASQGIHHCIDTRSMDLKTEITRVFGDQGVHVIYDCAAVLASFEQALNCASNASSIVIVGNFKVLFELDITRLQRREIALLSVMGTSRDNFLESVQLLAGGIIRTKGVVSRVFPLDQLDKAYTFIEQNPSEAMKVMLQF